MKGSSSNEHGSSDDDWLWRWSSTEHNSSSGSRQNDAATEEAKDTSAEASGDWEGLLID